MVNFLLILVVYNRTWYHASLRLREFYGYTLKEIATQQARIREDHAKPATSVVHYQCQVAKLPETVQDLLHHKQILWSHARMIAEHFLGDDRMCELLALFGAQGGRMTVEQLEFVIRRIEGGVSHLDQDADGLVHELREDQTLKLVPDRGGHDILTAWPTLVAKPALIHREASHFHVTIVLADSPAKIAVTPSSFEELREWLVNRRTNTPLQEVEAMLFGFHSPGAP